MTSMEKEEAASEEHPEEAASNLCEECNSKASKYKCPGCSRRTCSLPCVTSHKHRFRCSGKRDTTHFVPLSQFDDSTLLSDFKLLEDVKRVAESSERWRAKLGGYPTFRLPFHMKSLRNAAFRKGTRLFFLPAGMYKRQKNKTKYNPRKNCIYWTIEWRFHSTNVILLEHGVPESTTLRSVIEKHLQPSPWKGKLRSFCEEGLDNLKFFIRKHQKGSKAPYCELDLNAPLSDLFGGLTILEYPAIHVYLSSDSYDFEVVDIFRPRQIQQETKVPTKDDDPSPVGVIFKEEEIIEDEKAVEPLVIDLLKSPETCSVKPSTPTPTPTNDSLYVQLEKSNSEERIPEKDKSFPSTLGGEVQVLDTEMEDFDLDQDLIDAYSFLMEQSNPDDFLAFNPEGERQYHDLDDLVFPDVEELEEGEIPN